MQGAKKIGGKLPRYIIDEPAKRDSFQSHSAIVTGILRTIINEPRIRMIGLLGRWGTGKSTIVHQFEQRLAAEHSGKFVVFKYDAWAHQGDPARRSILEELISFLIGKRLTKKSLWDDTLQEIAGEKEDSRTKKESKLTWMAKVLLIILIPFPFIVSLLDYNVLLSVFTEKPSDVGRAIVISTLSYILLLVGIFPTAFLATRKWSTLKGKAWRTAVVDFWQSGPDILSLILTRNTEDSISTTVRKPQPTTIEFRKILRRVIKSQKESRLVFVIDNLDRIDPLEALGIWSVIIGLVADEAHRVDIEKEPLVIVPLDKQALSDLVRTQHNGMFDSEQLVEKSFDVVFEIPPPVLSDWREYFETQFRQLGLGQGADTSSQIFWSARHFEYWISTQADKRITPRKINRFLNQIVSLKIQQPEPVSSSLAAYYIAHKRDAENDILSLLLTGEPGGEVGTAWQTALAAVHFGVRHENAAQVSLGEELRKALETNDRDAFVRMLTVRGFDGVLEKYIETPPTLPDGHSDGGALIKLSAYLASQGSSDSFEFHWGRLWTALRGAGLQNLQTDVVPEAVRALIAHHPESMTDAEATTLITIVIDGIDRAKDDDEIADIINVGSELLATGMPEQTVSVTGVPLALKILAHSKDTSAFAKAMRCDSSFQNLARHFLEEIQQDTPWAVPSRIALIGRERAEKAFEGDRMAFYAELVSGMAEILRDEETGDSKIAAAVRLFAERSHAKAQFDELASDLHEEGVISRLTSAALANQKSAVTSPIIALRVTYGFDFEDEDELSEALNLFSNSDAAFSALTAIRAMNGGSFLPVFRRLETDESNLSRLLQPLLKEAIKRSHLGHLIDLQWAIDRFRSFRSGLTETEARSLAILLSRVGTFESSILETTEAVFSDFIEFLEKPVASGLITKRFAAYAEADWAKLLSQETALWPWIQNSKAPLLDSQSKGSPLHNGIMSVFSSQGGALGHRGVWRISKMLPWLDDRTRTDVVKFAVRLAAEKSDADLLLLLSRNDGFREETIRKAAAREVIVALFESLSRGAAGRAYIERNIDALKGVAPESLKRVHSRIGRALRSKDEGVREWARFVNGRLQSFK